MLVWEDYNMTTSKSDNATWKDKSIYNSEWRDVKDEGQTAETQKDISNNESIFYQQVDEEFTRTNK